MILKIRRIKELFLLLIEYIKTEGISSTFKRAKGFLQRRMKAKKGRFLPPKDALEKQKSYKCHSVRTVQSALLHHCSIPIKNTLPNMCRVF